MSDHEQRTMTNLSYRMLQSASTDSMSGRGSLAASNFSASASDNLSNSKSSTKSYLEATYEKIRTVGKGAFGTAVLYRRLTDSKMVVLKEINMSELSANERQMALNEVEVLSVLHHPNIISYLGSFEADGMLVIEMEYADGGTLSQFISRAKSPIGELEILTFFKQIVSAIQYMHEHSILHRDLKTANIFLTKEDLVKIGDFGISKVMNTKSQAHTVLGTPYYISPEMCEGKQYDQKSDMWALGCILYELACREKTFQGSNLPALVNKIMKGSYEPLPTIYSSSLKLMVSDLLQKDPALRPTASVITSRVSQLFEKTKTKMASSKNFSAFMNGSKERSVLYTLSGYGMTFSLIPVPLPPKSKIVEFAISSSHYIALTADSLVYTWGEGKRGQLALDLTAEWVNEPTLAESLMSKSIRQVAAGNGFSVFLGDSGMVLTCGEGTTGCLGHGDFGSQESPRLVEDDVMRMIKLEGIAANSLTVPFTSCVANTQNTVCGGSLLTLTIVQTACHCVVNFLQEKDGFLEVSSLQVWENLYDIYPESLLNVDVVQISCSENHVVALTRDGKVYTWGTLPSHELSSVSTPQELKIENNLRVSSVTAGQEATGLVTVCGKLLVQGNNGFNKLGLNQTFLGYTKIVGEARLPTRVTSLSKWFVMSVSFGRSHSAVLTKGGYVVTMGSNSESQLGHTRKYPSVVGSVTDRVITMAVCGPTYTVVRSQENAVYFWGTRFTQGSVSSGNELRVSMTTLETQVVSSAQEILVLYASESQITKGHVVTLTSLHPLWHCMFVLVETTAPLAKLEWQDSGIDEQTPAEDNECDSLGPVPDWIKAELAQATEEWQGEYLPSGHSSSSRSRSK